MTKFQYPSNLFEWFDFLDRQGVPKNEHWKSIGHFIERKSRIQHIPIHAKFELTPLCNFDCKMCYVHLNDKQFDKSELVPVKQWKQLVDSACKLGLREVALTGGECLTYPDFDELYMYLIQSGIKVAVMSNGFFIDDKRIKMFKQYPLSIIQISIYGSSEDAYESVTGVRAYRKVYENIEKVRDAGIPIRLAITPSIFMRNDVEHLIQLAKSLNIKYGINPQLMEPRKNTGRIKNDLSTDEYLEIYHLLRTFYQGKNKPVNYSDLPEEGHGGSQRFGTRCGAGRSSFGIKYTGEMCPCLALDEITVDPLEVGFEQAWHYINEQAEIYPIPLECGDCVYHKSCLSCVAVHKDAPEKGHCDPEVCKRMKALVKEGFIPLNKIC